MIYKKKYILILLHRKVTKISMRIIMRIFVAVYMWVNALCFMRLGV